MKIAMPAVNRTLPENVHHWFESAPGFIIYDSETEKIEYIRNFMRYGNNRGIIAAEILIMKGAKIIVSSQIDKKTRKYIADAGVILFDQFSGTCSQAVEKALNTSGSKPQQRNRSSLQSFSYIKTYHIFKGQNVQYIDWDFIRPLKALEHSPFNWEAPVNYRDGGYLLDLEVLKMKNTVEPVELEFGMFNLPPEEDSERLERVSYGQYCRINLPGKYMHAAYLKDMEETTVVSSYKDWDWSKGFHAPFVLIKPYGQDPYPMEIDLSVTIFEAEPPNS